MSTDYLQVGQEDGREDEGSHPVGVRVAIDAYDAVAVSAFCGISCSLPMKDKKGKPMVVTIHPWLMLASVSPLAIIQIMLILFLRAEVTMNAPIRDGEGEDWRLSHNRRLQSQLVAIAVVQGMVFKKMGDAVTLFCFLSNPFTWIEIKRPDPQRMKPFERVYNAVWLAPPSLIAIFCKMLVAYLVCVESISIIFECKTPKSAVFNSLVILFLIDLDSAYWGVIQTFFRFSDFDAFVFKTADEKLQKKLREGGLYFINFLRKCLGFLSRKRYGLVIEQLATACIIIFVYMRQIAIILYALDKNVIPAALDVCTQWRMEKGMAQTALNRIFQKIVPGIEAALHIEEIPDNLNAANKTASFDMSHCMGLRYRRMRTSEFFSTLWNHPTTTIAVSSALVVTLVIPTVAQYVKWYSGTEMVEALGAHAAGEDEDDSHDHRDGLTLKEEVQKLKKELKQLQAICGVGASRNSTKVAGSESLNRWRNNEGGGGS